MITIKRYGEHYFLSDKKKNTWFGSMDNAKDYIRLHYGCECRLYYFPFFNFYIVRLCQH